MNHIPSPPLAPVATSDLFEAGVPSREDAERWAESRNFPIAEPGMLTFAWTGQADAVELLRWIRAGVDRVAFHRVKGTDLWLLHLAVPDNARFEYKLAVRRGGDERWTLDPRNPARAADPFGENSVAQAWGYERPDWTRAKGSPPGRLVPFDVDSAIFGETRHEVVYLPAGYDEDAPYPLVVIHDGHDFNTYADLSVILDNLIAAGDIPPAIVVLIQTRDRMSEYPGGRRHARYLVDELLPAATSRFKLSERSSDRILLGASLGAVASLSTAFRYPGVFGGLVLKSGSFILDERKLAERAGHPVFHRTARLVRALRRAPTLPPTRAFISTGDFEGLAEDNRALASLLAERGAMVKFSAAWDGHHWHNWRDQLRDGLMWVLNMDSRQD